MSPTENSWVSAPEVFHEIIEGEAVIVSMRSGIYYSTAKSGAAIWDLVVSGNSLGEIVEVVANRYEGDRDVIADSVQRLIDRLQEEELIVVNARARPDRKAPASPTASEEENRPLFEEPVLEKYTDMEQLLLLDPIHDVDETGWPKAKPEGE